MDIQLLPLVPNALLPSCAPATTREHVPPGYGVQEQCLPFTAATALGFLIGSPIAFGLCQPSDVPPHGLAFRSPLDRPGSNSRFEDERVFYVKDNPRCSFCNNAFTLETVNIPDARGKRSLRPVQPGISFFDREDQRNLFKLHLPYIWRTPLEMDTLFLPAVNRGSDGFTILAGLVETDWYTNPVNLVIRKPPLGQAFHVAAGDPIAQAIFVVRSHRRPTLKVLASHARLTRDLRAAWGGWYQQHAEDRSAYKKLARSHQGRMSTEKES